MEDNNNDGLLYEDMYDIISFAGFDFSKWYEGEKDILIPQLEEAGYTDIHFEMGEKDSFGPLSRVCFCKDNLGNKRRFVYG